MLVTFLSKKKREQKKKKQKTKTDSTSLKMHLFQGLHSWIQMIQGPTNCRVIYLPLILPGPGGAYKLKSRSRREWIGVSKRIFLQFSLQESFLPSLSKIYSKHTFNTISYKKTKQKENFESLCDPSVIRSNALLKSKTLPIQRHSSSLF